MEQKIRALKREREAMKALDMETKPISNKIKQKINDYEEFCDKAGVKPAINRLRYEGGTSDITKTKAWEIHEKSMESKIADFHGNDTIKETKEEKDSTVAEIIKLGKVNKKIFQEKYGKIQTDEVIVTNERIAHIKHPQDYDLFEQFCGECICTPDLVISDEKNIGTVFMIKKLPETNLNIVLRLVLENEQSTLKNSVMTFWRIRDRNLQKLIAKNQVLYKKE